MQRGDVIGGRFEIDEYVTSGGMGRLFRARDVQSGEIVAVKMLLGDPAALGPRFDREGNALAMLSHPGIVRYMAHGLAASGEPYLAMEWLEGEDLASRLSRGKLSLEDSLQLATRVAEAMHVAHVRGIVHRDLKPGNIFLVDGHHDRVKGARFRHRPPAGDHEAAKAAIAAARARLFAIAAKIVSPSTARASSRTCPRTARPWSSRDDGWGRRSRAGRGGARGRSIT